jgi:anti-sigma factor RsiW
MRTGGHIDDRIAVDYIDGQLDAATAEEVRKHVEGGCGGCADTLSLWSRTIQALQADRAPDLSEVVVQRAIRLFDDFAPPLTILDRLVAILRYDSRQVPLPAGARGGRMQEFQLRFEAPGVTVTLLCAPDGELWRMMGQILPPGESGLGGHVVVVAPDHEIESVSEATGEFSLRGLAPARYEVHLQHAGREVVLPGIDLADP